MKNYFGVLRYVTLHDVTEQRYKNSLICFIFDGGGVKSMAAAGSGKSGETGGDGPPDQDNPFSFTKFIKKRGTDKSGSDSDWDEGDSETLSEEESTIVEGVLVNNHHGFIIAHSLWMIIQREWAIKPWWLLLVPSVQS